MKVKTSVTLSPAALEAIDELARLGTPRSRVVEVAVLELAERRRRQRREAKDLEILNRSAKRLNRETEEILAFQIVP